MRDILLFLIIVSTASALRAQYPTQLDTVENTFQAPYDNIVYLHISRDRLFGDTWNQSTGFFIAPNIILTAAHNIYSSSTSAVQEVEISRAKYYAANGGFSVIRGGNACKQQIRTHPSYRFAMRASKRILYDFGIIILNEAQMAELNSQSLKPFSVDPSFTLKSGDILNVAGYPANPDDGYHGDFMTFQQDRCGAVFPATFNHKLTTSTGNSGSPVWVERDGRRIVVGIHTFAGAGTLLSPNNYAVLMQLISL